ncbi:MAG: hypothetical protein ACXWQ8_00290 [Ktedonobacterales bacterium]
MQAHTENDSHSQAQELTPGAKILASFSDVYTWVAVYEDGSECREVEDDGTEHNFSHVDVGRVRFFVLLPLRDGLRAHVLRIDSADQRPIFLRRTSMELSPEGETLGQKRIHCLGWQKTISGVNVKAFTWIFEDGSLLVTDNDDVA